MWGRSRIGLGGRWALFAGLSFSPWAQADDAPLIRFDPATARFDRVLPHGRPFTVEVPVRAAVTRVEIQVWEQLDARCTEGRRQARSGVGRAPADVPDERPKHFLVPMPRLAYSTRYCFFVRIAQSWPAGLTGQLTAAVGDAVRGLAGQSEIRTSALRRQLEGEVPHLDEILVWRGTHAVPLDQVLATWLKDDATFGEPWPPRGIWTKR